MTKRPKYTTRELGKVGRVGNTMKAECRALIRPFIYDDNDDHKEREQKRENTAFWKITGILP